MFLTEMNRGRSAKRQVFVQFEFAQHTHRKARTVVVNLSIPLLSRLRVYVSVILNLYVLHMQTKQEAIMKPPLIYIRAVLHFAFLCQKTQGKCKGNERNKAPQTIHAHRNNNVRKGLFIA